MSRPQRPVQVRPARPAQPSHPARPQQPAQQHSAGRTLPRVSAPESRPSAVPTPGLYAGLDRSSFPVTPGFLQALARQSNVAWLGAYLQPAPNAGTRPGQASSRGWMEHVSGVHDEGFGVMAVYVGEQSVEATQPRLSKHANKRKGETDAIEAAANADAAHLGKGAVIYLDIEMIRDPTVIDSDTLEYASAFFAGVAARGYCPGLYIPFQMARALAARWPGLPVWVVNGTWPVATPLRGDTQTTPAPVDPLGRELARVFVERPAIVLSRTHRIANSNQPDRADNRLDFPLHWQHTLDRPVTIPVLERGGDSGWDFNVSLTRDPSFPAAEPRLALVPGTERVVALGSLPPARDATGVRTDGPGRFGDLWTSQAAPPSAGAIPPDAGRGERLHPWSRPSAAQVAGSDTSVMLLTTASHPIEIGWTLTQATRWTRATELRGAGAPEVRPHPGVRLLRFGAEMLWFAIGAGDQNDGRVLTSRRIGSADWEAAAPIGTQFRTHPLSALACVQRNGEMVDVFVLDADGRLHTFWRSRRETRFADDHHRQIGGTQVALHPQTSITAVEARDSIDVFVVGMDGLVYTTRWRDSADWTDLRAIGAPTFKPLFPASVAAVVRGDVPESTDVFIVDQTGRLATTWRGIAQDWQPANAAYIGGTTTYPHPLTDVVAGSIAPDRIAVTVVAHSGVPMRSTWGASAGGGMPAWSDLAAVELPAFVAPPTAPP